MLRRFVSPLALLIVVLAALPLSAADPALDAISSEASAVIRFKNPKASIAKVADLADLVAKGTGDLVRLQSGGLGKAISNPTLGGVNMEADWWLAVYATAGEKEPDVVFVIPATDLKAMKEALPDDVKFMESGKLGVYTTDDEAAKKTAARLKGTGKSISTLFDKDSTALFEAGDFSIFINVSQLATTFKSQIDEARDEIADKLENVPGAPPGVDTEKITEIVKKLSALVVQGINDAQSCTIAATVSKEGLSFEDLVRVKAGSPTDKLLAKSPPGAMASLPALPVGSLGYFGLAWDMSDFAQIGQMLMGAGVLTPEVAKELDATMKEIAKLKIGSSVGAFGLGDIEGGAVRSVTVTEIDNPTKMREITQKMTKAMSKVESQGVKQTITVKPDAEKIGKNSADILMVKTEVDEAQNPFGGMVKQLMTVLYGEDGMTTRSVYLKDRVVQTVGGGKQPMIDVLAALDRKPAETTTTKSAVQQTRTKLGAKSNFLFLFDVPNTIGKILGMVVDSGAVPIPLDGEAVKGLQGKPSYLGVSAATEPQGLRVKTHVPVEQMQGIAKIVQFAQGIAAGFGAGNVEEN